MDRSSPVSVQVERREDPPVVVVQVAGELDFGTTPRLSEAIAGEPPAGATMILELSELSFCDSSALGAMIAAHKAAEARQGRLYLTGVQPQVHSAITVTSLDQLFRIRPDVASVYAEIEGA